MTDLAPHPETRRGRIDLVDIMRALALIAMATYHFTWDLDFHGLIARGTATEGGWRLFARCIATSFLFLVGISLVLAHGRNIRWRSFAIREAQVAVGALAITLVTLFITPGSFVFFGILHQIALASLIGLAFLRLPGPVTLLAGAIAVALPFFVETPLTNSRWLAWIGLSASNPVTNDYVPILPWTGVVLIGIAAGRFMDGIDGWKHLSALNDRLKGLRPLTLLGRHSLLFYLLHQPILFGLVAGYAAVFPPDQVALFAASCRHECRVSRDAPTCETFCSCVQTRLERDELLERLITGRTNEAENASVRETVLQCSFPGSSNEP